MYILNGKEKAALITIARRVRIDYLKSNHYTYLEDDIDMFDENIFVSEENVEKNYEEKYDRNICASQMEEVFGDPFLLKSSKALTYREKLVLFSYYWEETTDEKIGKELHLKGDTVRKIRNRALKKIEKEYLKLKGDGKYDF